MKCLVICAKFQFPMKTKDLQDIMQSYCVEHNVKIRRVDERPGRDWIRNFQERWQHKVKLKRPTNIKRSRAKVSPANVREFFARLTPNLEGILATHVFNYDKTNFRDDPGAEEAFFGGGCKYYEQAGHFSKPKFLYIYLQYVSFFLVS